jgi:hypothetical protein
MWFFEHFQWHCGLTSVPLTTLQLVASGTDIDTCAQPAAADKAMHASAKHDVVLSGQLLLGVCGCAVRM